jgi:hypothetical protein
MTTFADWPPRTGFPSDAHAPVVAAIAVADLI